MDEFQQIIQEAQEVYPKIKAKLDDQSQQIAGLQSDNSALAERARNAEAGLPVDAVSPTQLADFRAVVESLKSLVA